MNYNSFSAADFIKDEYFQRWVLNPDVESDAFWQTFQQQHPHLQPSILEARRFLLAFHIKEKDIIESRISQLKRRIDLALDQPSAATRPAETKPLVKARRRPGAYAIAASISALLVCAFVWLWMQQGSLPFATATRDVVTQKGQRSLITLNDGTKVWMNNDSRLTYPNSFEGQPLREVSLEGEAFFDVAENKAQPFIVHTADIDVKVLGTAFNVRSYQDQNVETTLVRGKVNIASTGQQARVVTMLPNQRVVYEKNSQQLLLENRVNTEKYTAWREGRLIFEDQPLSEIVQALERWYNVTIRVEDTGSLGCRFSAHIDNKSLEEVLELFKASENIDYRRQGNQVSILGKLCAE